MPFHPHTPESLLLRSDSKNPSETCRGLTNDGRPCRRALSKTPRSSPSSSPHRVSGVEAYCWQHQDQAADRISPSPRSNRPAIIRERTSVDTLVDRLGLLDVGTKKQERITHKKTAFVHEQEKSSYHNPQRSQRPESRPRETSNLALLCCVGEADNSKKAPRPVKNSHGGRPNTHAPTQQRSKLPQGAQMKESIHRPPINRDPSSKTEELMSLIPSSASPSVAASLLAELAKPVSESDDEGFIYMFWLTPESLSSIPPSETVTSLLAPPSRPEPGRRRTSDVLNSFATSPADKANPKKIMLKIGRAQNVQRRLNQWTRQCGYNISLIRFYPYHPTSLSQSDHNGGPKTPIKVPNVHKVERLIHIELNGQRAKDSGKCNTCGREHREWFEVEASKAGVKAVDETIRRWVEYGMR